MKKYIYSIFIITFFNYSFSQTGRVGINTESPKSSLDVNGKTDSGGNSLSTDITGLQAPRITRLELTSKGNILYGADQKGALIYITDVSGGDNASQRVNITSVGYYYFDGLFWIKIGSGATFATVSSDNGLTKTADNIQLGGTLLKSTDIATEGFNTTFSGTGKIGIGNTSPTQKLDVTGTVRASDKLMVGTTWTGGGALSVKNNISTDNIVSIVGSDNTYKAVLLDNGNFGLSTNLPTEKLDVNGSIRARTINNSTDLSDVTLVADSNGVIKKKKNETVGIFRGYVTSDVSTPYVDSIYRINNLTELFDPGNNMDATTGYFTPSETGLYKITINITSKKNGAANVPNYVFGLAYPNASSPVLSTWVVRFSVPSADYNNDSGESTSTIGIAKSFQGVGQLTAGVKYFFGITQQISLLAFPSGTTGAGIGSFLEIQQIK